MIQKLLVDRGVIFSQERTEWPLSVKEVIFFAGDDFPSIFSMKTGPSGVVEIYFNSFCKLGELAGTLSGEFSVPVVVNQYQSVATASYWVLYRDGVLRREIEAGDGEIYAQTGEPLQCEPDRDSSSGEDDTFFDYEDMDRLNEFVGIPVSVYEEPQAGWDNFVVDIPEAQGRAWWKFW